MVEREIGEAVEDYEMRVAGGMTARQLLMAALAAGAPALLSQALGAATGLGQAALGPVCVALSAPLWALAFDRRLFGMPARDYLGLWWRQNVRPQHLAYSCRARLAADGALPSPAAPSPAEEALRALRGAEAWAPGAEGGADRG